MKKVGPIVILGARGMLGTDLMACCRAHHLDAAGCDLPEFSITDSEQLKTVVRAGSVIVNCAAYTNVDLAERQEALAVQVNGYAVGALGRLAAKADVPVIHISTDFIFDGTLDRPYAETDKPNPLSAYGRSKLEGERQLAAAGCRYCLLRVEWTYGQAGTNFVKKIVEAAETRPLLRVIDDQIGSPTATTELADVICKLIEQDTFPEGIYHAAAGEYTSRYDMARFLCRLKGIEVQIEPCKTADFDSPARRPLNSRFTCQKLESLLGHKMRPWQEPLKEFLERI